VFEFVTIAGTRMPECRNDDSHVIVCGNEKGGSGKSTTAVHLAIGLMKLGFSVATIDLDMRQQTLSRHLEYRNRWMRSTGHELITPAHHILRQEGWDERTLSDDNDLNAQFVQALEHFRYSCDFLIIDTPGSHTLLSQLAHRAADTLVTPINDSFIDFDVLARIDAENFEIEGLSQYALEVRTARRYRQANRGGILDWVVVRNRMSQISSRNEQRVEKCLRDLSKQLGFRISHGIGERVIFREFFQSGLTALDDTEETGNIRPATMSHIAARTEVRKLIACLHLPIDQAGIRRAAARKQWLEGGKKDVVLPKIFA
jgi:chromosome partitioning protein